MREISPESVITAEDLIYIKKLDKEARQSLMKKLTPKQRQELAEIRAKQQIAAGNAKLAKLRAEERKLDTKLKIEIGGQLIAVVKKTLQEDKNAPGILAKLESSGIKTPEPLRGKIQELDAKLGVNSDNDKSDQKLITIGKWILETERTRKKHTPEMPSLPEMIFMAFPKQFAKKLDNSICEWINEITTLEQTEESKTAKNEQEQNNPPTQKEPETNQTE